MWTIFTVFIECVVILLLFYALVFWPQGMWGLSFPTRDHTHTPCTGRWFLTTGPPGKSLDSISKRGRRCPLWGAKITTLPHFPLPFWWSAQGRVTCLILQHALGVLEEDFKTSPLMGNRSFQTGGKGLVFLSFHVVSLKTRWKLENKGLVILLFAAAREQRLDWQEMDVSVGWSLSVIFPSPVSLLKRENGTSEHRIEKSSNVSDALRRTHSVYSTNNFKMLTCINSFKGLPMRQSVEESTCKCRRHQETQVRSLGLEDSLE